MNVSELYNLTHWITREIHQTNIEKEAANEKKAGIKEITSQVAKQLVLKEDDGDKVKALDTAVKNLVNFIKKGGVVDFVIPESDEEDEGEEYGDSNDQLNGTL